LELMAVENNISLENTTLYTLQFADDQVILAGDKRFGVYDA